MTLGSCFFVAEQHDLFACICLIGCEKAFEFILQVHNILD